MTDRQELPGEGPLVGAIASAIRKTDDPTDAALAVIEALGLHWSSGGYWTCAFTGERRG